MACDEDEQLKGSYSLSYLDLSICTTDETDISKFGQEDLRTFLHEYIHFLQDISSYYGVYRAGIEMQQIAFAFHRHDELTKSIIGDKYPIPDKFKKAFQEKNDTIGDWHCDDCVLPYSFEYVKSIDDYCVNIEVKDTFLDTDIVRRFGSYYILEGMASAIENEVYGRIDQLYFPYDVAMDFAQKTLCRSLSTREFVLICDYSLQSIQPGRAFHDALLKIRKHGCSIEEIINNAILNMRSGDKFSPNQVAKVTFESEAFKESIFNVFKNSYRKGIGDFLCSYFEQGTLMRLQNFNFIADLARPADDILNERLDALYRDIGAPLIFTKGGYVGCKSPRLDTEQHALSLSFLHYYFEKISKDVLPTSCFYHDFCPEKYASIKNELCEKNILIKCHEPLLCPASSLALSLGLCFEVPPTEKNISD